MKILTKEEEAAHNTATWEGGLLGGAAGLAVGVAGVYAASLRFPAFRHLSLPFRAFLVTGTTSFAAVTSADRASRRFEKTRHADADYQNTSETTAAALSSTQTPTQRFKTLVSEQRYSIVFGSWVVSMAGAFALVSRSPHLTGQQKLVQARVYAQGLTLAVLVASFALEGNDLKEGRGRWETIKVVDPADSKHVIEKRVHHEAYQGEDQWMDMVESQDRKHKEKEHEKQEREQKREKGRKEKAKEAGESASKTASAPSKDRQKDVHQDKGRSDGAGKG